MRKIVFATAAVLLAACGQGGAPNGAAGGGNGGPATLDSVFPNLFQASYRSDVTITNPENGETRPMVIIRDGRKMRVEIVQDGTASAIVTNLDANEAFTLSERAGQRMAVRMPLDAAQVTDAMKSWSGEGRTITRTGSCSVAGASGTEWAQAPSENDPKARTSCVTSDGIFLRGTEDGVTTWETTSVQRGAQDPALFTIPAGYQVMDLGPMAAQMREAMERMKAQQNQ
ncbi:MAG: hypothetical protein ABW199_12055 [Caulobacterales bacterium]